MAPALVMDSYIVPEGTQVVLREDLSAFGGERLVARGTVGRIVQCPLDSTHSYGIQLVDGAMVNVLRKQFSIRKHSYHDDFESSSGLLAEYDLRQHVILRCVIGSQAYGLATGESDVDLRGVYLPPADLHWSLFGVPEQLESKATEECYWELQKFLVLALKANPNILECLYTPLVREATDLGRDLLAMRQSLVSKLAYRTYNGYVLSQFKKLEQDLRTDGKPKWKHAMHLIRLLLSGISLLETGAVEIEVGASRDFLLEIKRGSVPWEKVNQERLTLHRRFEEAYGNTCLPERPDYAAANRFLLRARKEAIR